MERLENYRILVIEDSPEYQALIQKSLGSKNRNHMYVSSLFEARKALEERKEEFDLIILDLVLPDGFGFQFFSEMKNELNIGTTPVIILTVKGETSDKVVGLSLGVHDYITKPFDLLELNARVKNRIELVKEIDQQKRRQQLGNLELDFDSMQAHIVGAHPQETEHLDLSPLEFKLLGYLITNKDRVLTRETLLNNIWGSGRNVLDRTVDSTIASVRKKTKNWDHSIQSIYGVGYKLSISSKKKSENLSNEAQKEILFQEMSKAKILKRFHEDESLFQSVSRLFITQADTQIQAIKEDVRNSNWDQAARNVHQLRGALLNFTEVSSEFSEDIEKQLSEGQIEREQLELFLKHVNFVKDWLQSQVQAA